MNKRRQFIGLIVALVCIGLVSVTHLPWTETVSLQTNEVPLTPVASEPHDRLVIRVLQTLPVKGKAQKTGYTRMQFGDGWATTNGCDTRNDILRRDLTHTTIKDECTVMAGTLNDPYTGKTIRFERGAKTSSLVQIDHVVALSNAWQTGGQQLSLATRMIFANDPLELLAVDGQANQQKSDGDAATWLPPNMVFRCKYVALQVAVKEKYALWVTTAEKQAIQRVLSVCPYQQMPTTVRDIS